jgi:alkylated DNA repair protein (DNA oxidative demethylase)
MQVELFDLPETTPEGLCLLRGYAREAAPDLLDVIAAVAEAAPFRRMTTPGGQVMSAAMTSFGALGWVTDRKGYRYTARDPLSGQIWPAMPERLRDLAVAAAHEAGFGFAPDSCLINRYEVGARMGLHQDADEPDETAPIVSVSLGLPVTFLWGGLRRTDKVARLELRHGDVAVWGGTMRRAYHGVAPLKAGRHELTGALRYNLTFRKAA